MHKLNTIDDFKIGDEVIVESTDSVYYICPSEHLGEQHRVTYIGGYGVVLSKSLVLGPEALIKVDDLPELVARRAPIEVGDEVVVESPIYARREGVGEHRPGGAAPQVGDVVTISNLGSAYDHFNLSTTTGFLLAREGVLKLDEAALQSLASDEALERLREALSIDDEPPYAVGDKVVVQPDAYYGNKHRSMSAAEHVGRTVEVVKIYDGRDPHRLGGDLRVCGDFEFTISPDCVEPAKPANATELRVDVRFFIGGLDITDSCESLLGK